MQGRVKWFNDAKGYGFISGEDGKDYFAHFSEIQSQTGRKTLQENQDVVFQPLEEVKGPRAKAIVLSPVVA